MKKILTNNIRMKATAVLLAIGLWLYVYIDHHPRNFDTYQARVVYVNQARPLFIESPVQTVRLNLKGDARDIDSIDSQKLWVEADLAGKDMGTHQVPLIVHNMTVAVQVINENLSIRVVLKQLPSVEKPVEVYLSGTLPSGKTNGVPRPDKVSITFYGKESSLNRIVKAAVKLDLAGESRDFSARSRVFALDGNGVQVVGVMAVPEEIYVTVPVHNAVARALPVQLIYSGRLIDEKKSVVLEIAPPTVTVFGDEQMIETLKAVRTEKFDAALCRIGAPFTVRLEPPKSIVASPSEVNITCSVQAVVSRVFTVNITSVNLAPGLRAQLDPDNISVTVEGSQAYTDAIASGTISATADLAGKTPGMYSITPVVKAPETRGASANIKYEKSPINVTITRK